MQAADQLAQLGAGEARLLAGLLEQVGRGRVGIVAEPPLGQRDHVPEGDEPLLGAVVQVAPDAPALLVDDVQQARARRVERGLAGAEGDLVAAALDLGRRPRGEHQQRRVLVGARHDRPRREHADVARPRGPRRRAGPR